MKALQSPPVGVCGVMVSGEERFVKKIREEFARFEKTMEELHFLRQVSQDLRSFKEMMKIKKYD